MPRLPPKGELESRKPGTFASARATLYRITVRRIEYGLAAMVALLVAGIVIGLIWADTSDVAGSIAVVTNIVGGVGIVLLLIAFAVTRRRPS